MISQCYISNAKCCYKWSHSTFILGATKLKYGLFCSVVLSDSSNKEKYKKVTVILSTNLYKTQLYLFIHPEQSISTNLLEYKQSLHHKDSKIDSMMQPVKIENDGDFPRLMHLNTESSNFDCHLDNEFLCFFSVL